MSYRVTHLSRKSPYLARCAAWLVLCLIATAGPAAHAEDESALTLRDVQVSLDEGVYELDAKVDLTLPEGARKAVESGLTAVTLEASVQSATWPCTATVAVQDPLDPRIDLTWID